jgi:hypothetical protein
MVIVLHLLVSLHAINAAAVTLDTSGEVAVFRGAFVARKFSRVEELIAQYRKSLKSLPQDPEGKTLLHYAIQVSSGARCSVH